MKPNSKKKIVTNLAPFILGLATSFSLPPYNFLIINFIIFPFLILLIIENIQESKLTVFKIGWFYGFGYFFSSLYWITNALTFEEIFKPLIPIALIIIPLFLGLFYGFGILIFSFFKLEKNLFTILLFSLIFSVVEFIRGSILGGFPWNLIVYSWTEYINSLQILSLVGTYSFNLISITIFSLPLIIFSNQSFRFKFILIFFTIFILLLNHIYGSLIIKKNNKNFHELDYRIKIVSPKIEISRYFEYDNEKEIIKELIELSNPSNFENTIFIFPEGALAGVNFDQLKSFKNLFLNNFSSNHIIIMGINTKKNSSTYNSMVVLNNELKLLSQYNKIKLVPFGEFLPFENILKKLGLRKISFGYESFSKGKDRKLLSIESNKFSFIPLICYEIIYSGNIKKELYETSFIINISEDGWFGNSIGPHQHFSHGIFRSIEEGKNVIRSTNNGISAFIDVNGRVVSRLESTQRGVIEINKYKKFNETLFSKFGNKIFFYIIIIYIGVIFFIKRRELK